MIFTKLCCQQDLLESNSELKTVKTVNQRNVIKRYPVVCSPVMNKCATELVFPSWPASEPSSPFAFPFFWAHLIFRNQRLVYNRLFLFNTDARIYKTFQARICNVHRFCEVITITVRCAVFKSEHLRAEPTSIIITK